MGRKKKNELEEANPPSRFKILCEQYRLLNGHLSIKELADKLGEYSQPRLSDFETRAEGPPLEMVEKYANYFKLKNKERFDFYLAALEASEKTKELDFSEIAPSFLDIFRKYLALILSNNRVGSLLNDEGVTIMAKSDERNPYYSLVTTWDKLKHDLEKLIEESVKTP